jgi:putative flippase GtrA
MQRLGPRASWLDTLAQILRFGFVGILNTISALAVIWLLMAAGAGPYPANFVGYALGVTIGFMMNRTWTFRHRDAIKWTQVMRYLLTFCISYLLNLAVVTLLLHAHVPPYIAQIGGIPVYTVCFFLMSKYFVFTSQHRNHPPNETT